MVLCGGGVSCAACISSLFIPHMFVVLDREREIMPAMGLAWRFVPRVPDSFFYHLLVFSSFRPLYISHSICCGCFRHNVVCACIHVFGTVMYFSMLCKRLGNSVFSSSPLNPLWMFKYIDLYEGNTTEREMTFFQLVKFHDVGKNGHHFVQTLNLFICMKHVCYWRGSLNTERNGWRERFNGGMHNRPPASPKTYIHFLYFLVL